ncbi:MAG: hypothetical protein JNK00_00330 [Flavipsychrobacter sp.]|nr:hypothetical protein [Flavipsychrobacter sp.]
MRYSITWNNIPIEIEYNPDYSKAYMEFNGYALAHIGIKADRPLPITSTGYKSQFIAEPLVAEFGLVTEFVITLLNEAALGADWQKLQAEQAQLNLF